MEGEECHLPFTFTRANGRSSSEKTCVSEGHGSRFWCCLEETCDLGKPDMKFGFCPHDARGYFSESDWRVVTDSDEDAIFISLCGTLLATGDSDGCPESSQVCYKSRGQVQNAINANRVDIEELAEGDGLKSGFEILGSQMLELTNPMLSHYCDWSNNASEEFLTLVKVHVNWREYKSHCRTGLCARWPLEGTRAQCTFTQF